MIWTYRQTVDCVYLDVDICGDMNATTTHEIIAMAEEYPDMKSVNVEVESIHQWRGKLVAGQDRVQHKER